jgi:non-heme chloroperoxidase
VVLVHGSAGNSSSMHLLAKGFAGAGYAGFALDIRGHGASGSSGMIAYVGQLEDDLEAFMHRVAPPPPVTMVGFSAGGGFAIRFAGSDRQDLFHSYLLLSPFLGQDAPTLRPAGGGWVNVGIPRMLALTALNSLGIRWLNDLPVVRFALNEQARAVLTPAYSYALAANFHPQRDYQTNIRKIHRPCAVVAGIDDDVFYADKLEPTFRSLGKPWPVTLLPGIGHASLTMDPRGISAAVQAVQGLQAEKRELDHSSASV